MTTSERSQELKKDEILLAVRPAYHLRCLEEDATDPELSGVERLALVRDRELRIRQIEAELAIIPRATTQVISPEGGRR